MSAAVDAVLLGVVPRFWIVHHFIVVAVPRVNVYRTVIRMLMKFACRAVLVQKKNFHVQQSHAALLHTYCNDMLFGTTHDVLMQFN